MKKNVLLICLSVFAFLSCSSKDETVYSCDPAVNAWVKSNVSKIDQMNRTEWLKLSESRKVPAYRAFTNSQKQTFWLLKIDEIVQLGSWSDLEIKHLQKLYQMIEKHPEWFDDKFDKNVSGFMEMEKLSYEWKDEAKEALGWSDIFIKSVASTGNKVVDKKGSLEVTVIKSNVRFKSKSETTPSCDCGIGYFWSTCDSSLSTDTECKSDGCTKTLRGCSFLGLSPCDGTCYKVL